MRMVTKGIVEKDSEVVVTLVFSRPLLFISVDIGLHKLREDVLLYFLN